MGHNSSGLGNCPSFTLGVWPLCSTEGACMCPIPPENTFLYLLILSAMLEVSLLLLVMFQTFPAF